MAGTTPTVDKISPSDSRVKSAFAEVAGHRWHYLDAAPSSEQKGVVVLVHGFPDLSLAWRYQIPMLTGLGLRCIAIDCMGYADTGTSKDLNKFTYKTHADAIAGICDQLGAKSIILGGHDWGGAVVYRVAQWYPKLVSHVFAVCTPYFPVADTFVSTETLVKGPLPTFGYQLQFGSEDQKIERSVTNEARMRKFLNGLYGGKLQSGKHLMTAQHGIDLNALEDDSNEIAVTPLLNEEELDFYVFQYMKNGINGPCNWYRTRRINFDDERDMPADQQKGVHQPTLFICALNDFVLRPEMAKNMERSVPNLTFGEVNAGHWALWQTPKETNEIISNWFKNVVFGGKSKM